jgi:hypothetical protein
MKGDRPQHDHTGVYVVAFRHFRLIALSFQQEKKNRRSLQFFSFFYFLKNSSF